MTSNKLKEGLKEYFADKTTVMMDVVLRDYLFSLKIKKKESIQSVIKRLIATIKQNNLEIITEEVSIE